MYIYVFYCLYNLFVRLCVCIMFYNIHVIYMFINSKQSTVKSTYPLLVILLSPFQLFIANNLIQF